MLRSLLNLKTKTRSSFEWMLLELRHKRYLTRF
ncbi:hypothetical protein Goshw_007173 [Gossypium schwendimanii]|uniref:Uncharacterized protein n=3 Tax=Gossypium TaxID=3633 RepID=A0A7J9JUS1_9ROSI|nr:hypothetical protein [Gossypium laxum]MBA0837931.1 hypothetical protein [Gossypium armourianum]MBA0864909.1 hypothetical protein [Gossypium schwendimanii]